jgi:hypothetical protein
MNASVKCKKAEKFRSAFQAVVGFLTELARELYFGRNPFCMYSYLSPVRRILQIFLHIKKVK